METNLTDYPTVSVIMGVYNETPDMLKAAIESILMQSYTSFELIIIIDNPRAQLLISIIEDYAKNDNRIIVLQNDINIGLAKSLNRGIHIAKGKYIARMDADDISLKRRIEIEVSYLDDHPETDMVYSGTIEIDDDGNIINNKMVIPKNEKSLMQALEYKNIVVHPSVVIKTSLIKKIGGYNEYLASQDYDLWLRLKKNGCKFHCIEQALLLYRVRENNTTTQRSIDQYLSYRYAKFLYKNNKKFNKQQYLKYMEKKKMDTVFVNHMRNFMYSFQYHQLKKIIILLYYALIDHECRIDLFNFLNYKKHIKRIKTDIEL